MQLMMIETADPQQGFAAVEGLEQAVEDGRINVEDIALVYRNDKGKVKVKQTRDLSAGKGAVRGALVGAIIGLFPVSFLGAAAVGAGAGALMSGAGDKGVDNKMMKEIGRRLEGTSAMVFVLADDAAIEKIAAAIEADGHTVEYEVVPPETQRLIQEIAKQSDVLANA